jgi:uncharacterized membrane protein YkvA (DUF1232 family)
VSDQHELFPSGLSSSQFERLTECANMAELIRWEDLKRRVDQHIELTRSEHQRNRVVNLRLALAIQVVIDSLFDSLPAIETGHAWWLRGAIYYFAACDDDEPDFRSPIGFEDDAEILNACLKFAGRRNLCLNVEEFDDA